MCHSEESAPKKAAKPPLEEIMGRNQAKAVAPSDRIPRSCLLRPAPRIEKRKSGPRNRIEEGRMPAVIPKAMAVGTMKAVFPRSTRQHKEPISAEAAHSTL